MRSFDATVRPTATDQVFFNHTRRPTVNSVLQKGLYHGLISRSVANFNSKYAFLYGFIRGSTDCITATVQYLFAFDDMGAHRSRENRGFNEQSLLKVLYVAVNFFATVTILYSLCKIGELICWGAGSLVGRVDYRPFGLLDLIKIESLTFLMTTVLDTCSVGLDKVLFD